MKTKHLIMACILHFAVLFLYGAVTGFGYHETPVSAVFLSVYSIICWYFLWKERKHPVFRLCIAILLVLLMIRVTAVDFFAVLPPGPADICENVTLIASLVIFLLCGWTVWMKSRIAGLFLMAACILFLLILSTEKTPFSIERG